jgi:hypothetical protein
MNALEWFDQQIENGSTQADAMEPIAVLMDDEIREALHAKGFDDYRGFLVSYMAWHAAKYDGEEFQIG